MPKLNHSSALRTTLLAVAGSALLIGTASAQPWQQPEQTTTTKTVTTYTTSHDAPPPPPQEQYQYGPPPGAPHEGYGPGPAPLGARVGEVDQRIGQLNWRVGEMVHHGAISRHQGDWFHQQILNVQQMEQTYTTQNYGHLRPEQQQALNARLDRISHKLDRYAS